MSKQVVIDSSVAVKWTNSLDEELLPQSDAILKVAQQGKLSLFAPELLKYEVGNALLKKGLELSQTQASLASLYGVPITYIIDTQDLADAALEIAQLAQITYYDAAFISLAQKLNCPLITANPRHQQKFPGVKVVPLKNYK